VEILNRYYRLIGCQPDEADSDPRHLIPRYLARLSERAGRLDNNNCLLLDNAEFCGAFRVLRNRVVPDNSRKIYRFREFPVRSRSVPYLDYCRARELSALALAQSPPNAARIREQRLLSVAET
jgi:hypothetical protein